MSEFEEAEGVEERPVGRNDNEVLRDVSLAAAEPTPINPEADEVQAVVVPAGAEAQIVATDGFRAAPRRKTGLYDLHDAESLVAYVRDQGGEGTIWLDGQSDPPTVTAILNDHAKDKPGWGDHRAVLELAYSSEWKRWTRLDNKLDNQVVFAQHVEESIPEIIQPDGAEMLELAQNFRAMGKVEYRSAQRLHDGSVQMAYHEEIEASAGRDGRLQIPEIFVIRVAVFFGEEPQDVEVRLRYRVQAGNLSIGYKIDRRDILEDEAISRIGDRLRTDLGERVFAGAAPQDD